MSKSRIVVLSLAVVGLVGLAWAWRSGYWTARDAERGTIGSNGEGRSANSAAKNAGFVGSGACADCHSEITAAYQQTHSMARSSSVVGHETIIEDYVHAEFEPTGQRRYRVERGEAGVRHHELLLGRSGKTLFDHAETVAFIIGSGQRGRSYVVERDGLLFQSPISWYSQKLAWDLSPGYEPARHERFDRRIAKECLFCHVGRVEFSDPVASRLSAAPFPEPAIGCERCHGPGEAHVQAQRASRAAAPDRSIVNPARLEPARRDAVCHQCHLRSEQLFTRAGRNAFDFRPGEDYEATWLAFVQRPDQPETAVTIVEQLQSSECFLKSEGRLGCIACHDPHRRPTLAERSAFYRERCLKCHAERGCSQPEEQRQAAPAGDSCIACHMPPLPTKGVPHTALTDHRLRRDPSARPIKPAPRDVDVATLELFDRAAERLSPRDVRRANGLLRITAAASRNDRQLAGQAEKLFNPDGKEPAALLDEFSDDHAVLSNLGLVYVLTGRPQLAEAAWQRASRLEPTNESDLASLVQFHARMGNPNGAHEVAERLLAVNPHLAEYHWLQSSLFQQTRQLPEAIAAAERALVRDPTAQAVRVWLVRAYAQAGQPGKSAEQAALLRELRGP